jgi:hypothetical protein
VRHDLHPYLRGNVANEHPPLGNATRQGRNPGVSISYGEQFSSAAVVHRRNCHDRGVAWLLPR